MKKNPRLITLFEHTILPILDMGFFALAYILASVIRYKKLDFTILASLNFPILMAIILASFYIFDNYKIHTTIQGLRTPGRTIFATIIAGFGIIILAYLKGQERYIGEWFGRGMLPISLSIFALLASLCRFYLNKWFLDYQGNLNWLILGTYQDSPAFFQDFIKTFGRTNFNLLVRDHDSPHSSPIPIAGTWNDLDLWLDKSWAGIIINNPSYLPEEILNKLMRKRLAGVKIYDLIEFYEHIWLKVPVFTLRDAWLVTSQGFHLLHNPIGLKFKRLLDIITSLFFIITGSPVLLLAAFAIKLNDCGPILYSQIRTGEKGKEFLIYKFRTMTENAEKDGHQWATKNDNRITKIGRILRLTRIDEWPQFFNVLKGDMSFIGPRPERPMFNMELEKQIPYYGLRHLVKPGITGWAQVLFPYASSVEDAREKLQYDLYYIKNYSLLTDFTIFMKTIRVVLFGQGR